jgi:hypothetical protein
MRPNFNPYSKDWLLLKQWLEEEIQKIHSGFENYKDWETTLRYQEKIKVLKTIISMESASDAQD